MDRGFRGLGGWFVSLDRGRQKRRVRRKVVLSGLAAGLMVLAATWPTDAFATAQAQGPRVASNLTWSDPVFSSRVKG